MTPGLISVVIPSYNSTRTIERCIRSVLETGDEAVEVIVVDDASTDRSPGLVEAMAAADPQRVKLLRQEKNGGPAKARNAGAAAAKGEFLFFLDSDTDMLPDALANFRKRIAEADAVVGIYDARPLNKGWVPLYKALLNNYFFARKGVIAYEVFDSARAGIRAEIFRAVGGFDETLGWGMDYENEELGYRLCEKYKLVLDPAIAVKHEFPGLRKLTRTYFLRVALWMEILLVRRKFESGGVTSAETGLSSAALLCAALLAPLPFLPITATGNWITAIAALLLFTFYLYGYSGLFGFVLKRAPWFLLPAVLLNIYFTLVIALGASLGVLRTLTGKSQAGALTGSSAD
jgi:glycosyltransferase involved in cell wall biosynthesis